MLLFIQEHTPDIKDIAPNVTFYLSSFVSLIVFVDYLQCCTADDESSEFREGKHHTQCHGSLLPRFSYPPPHFILINVQMQYYSCCHKKLTIKVSFSFHLFSLTFWTSRRSHFILHAVLFCSFHSTDVCRKACVQATSMRLTKL